MQSSQTQSEPLERRTLFAATLPRPDHTVVLLLEDHSYSQILQTHLEGALAVWPTLVPDIQQSARNLRSLADHGASFTNAHSGGHRNLVDYNAIFSGYVPGPRDNPDKTPYTAPNIASELIAAGLTFGGYSESLPKVGFTGGKSGDYTRAHNVWVDFANVPAADNLPFSRFPHDYSQLPTVSYVVPNEQDNMHSGTVSDADQWFQNNIAPYARWAKTHNSLLVVTWDESHDSTDSIPTIFYGAGVRTGQYGEPITQANILATLEEMYGLAPTGQSATATPITDIFSTGAARSATPAATLDVLQATTARVSGTVFLDRNGDARPGAGDVFPSGWTIELDPVTNPAGKLHARKTVSHGGHFAFRHLAPGTYRLTAKPPHGLGPGVGAETIVVGSAI